MEGEEICTHVATHTFDERATCRNITFDLCCRKYFPEKLPCFSFISKRKETIGFPYQGKTASLFVCPARRQGIFLLEVEGNFWHNLNLWRANSQMVYNCSFWWLSTHICIYWIDKFNLAMSDFRDALVKSGAFSSFIDFWQKSIIK